MPCNWGTYRRGFTEYTVSYIPTAQEEDGVLMSRWETKPEATACARRMREMDEHAALLEAGQRDLFEED